MIDKISTILFLIGLLILLAVHVKMLHSNKNYNHDQQITMTIWVVISIVVLGAAWVIREIRYKDNFNNYRYAYQSGKIVGGTVYASYPDEVPGLGWIM
jgi:hypothetical protein